MLTRRAPFSRRCLQLGDSNFTQQVLESEDSWLLMFGVECQKCQKILPALKQVCGVCGALAASSRAVLS
jgi:hypothetical protein